MRITMSIGSFTTVLVAALCAAACSKDRDEKPAASPAAVASSPPAPAPAPAVADTTPRDTYHATVTDPELGDVTFYLAVPTPPATGHAIVIDGNRRIELTTTWTGDRVVMGVPMFGARIVAARDAASRGLTGLWEVKSALSGDPPRPFRADLREPDPAARIALGDGAPVDLGAPVTTWRATLPESGTAKLEVEQPAPGVVHVTISMQTGNVMYLSGNARGDMIRLSGFDGHSLYLVTGTFAPDRKSFAGTFSAGQKLEWREAIRAERAEPFDLDVTFGVEQGSDVKSMSQLATYAGKPLVVSLSGSWCANCFNANPVLREIYDKHRAAGLEVVTLLYEMSDDPEHDRRQAKVYTEAHHIPWNVIPVTGPVERTGELIPDGLQEVDLSAFPLAIFVRRDGTIHTARSGFPGPESKAAYERAVEAYRASAAAIVGGD